MAIGAFWTMRRSRYLCLVCQFFLGRILLWSFCALQFLEDEIKGAVRAATLSLRCVPTLCGAAFRNKGVQTLLDAVVDYLPSPLDIPPISGIDPEGGAEITRRADDDEPFSALAFKIVTDPYVGQLTFFRVYSGQLKSGTTVLNSERLLLVIWSILTNSNLIRDSGRPSSPLGPKQQTL